MSPNLRTLLANMGHAAFSRQSTRIGGGIFTWEEIGNAVVEIRGLHAGLAQAVGIIEYLAPEKFDSPEHFNTFFETLNTLKSLVKE